MKTAQQAAANWINSAGRAATEWQTGIQNYNGDWVGATVSQQSVMLNNLTQAVTSGRWAAGITSVGTGGWKQATVDKASNFSTGFQAGASKQASSIAKIINAEQGIVGALPPRGDYTANKARASAFMDAMHALKGQLGA